MSLTSFVALPDVRARFREEFERPKLPKRTDSLVPPPAKKASLIGVAFDYLLRFHIERLNSQAVTRPWTAESALSYLTVSSPELSHQAREWISLAKQNHSEFLYTGHLTDALLESTLSLAQLEPVFRRGYIPPSWEVIERQDLENLRDLITLVNFDLFKTNGVVLLNPTFGLASAMVGGADADLVIEDVLIEIKTVKNLSLEYDDFAQLIGYYTLSQIDEIDGASPQHEIKRLGVYFSRYAYLHLMNVEEVIDPQRFPQFLEWFKARANS
jgi:hypothetical protein